MSDRKVRIEYTIQSTYDQMDATIHAVLYPLRHPVRPVPQVREDGAYREQIRAALEAQGIAEDSDRHTWDSMADVVMAVVSPLLAERDRAQALLAEIGYGEDHSWRIEKEAQERITELTAQRDKALQELDAALVQRDEARRNDGNGIQRQIELSTMLRAMGRRAVRLRRGSVADLKMAREANRAAIRAMNERDRLTGWRSADRAAVLPADWREQIAQELVPGGDQSTYGRLVALTESWCLATPDAELGDEHDDERSWEFRVSDTYEVAMWMPGNEPWFIFSPLSGQFVQDEHVEGWRRFVPADGRHVARWHSASAAPVEAETPAPVDCGSCSRCLGSNHPYMIVCSECGNKRCPHATDHGNECTGSNEPGQPGSRYEHAVTPSPTLAQTRIGTDWCPSCRMEAGTNRYPADDCCGERCGACGSELGAKPEPHPTEADLAAAFDVLAMMDERAGFDRTAAHSEHVAEHVDPAPAAQPEPQDEAPLRRWVYGADDNPPWINPREAVDTGVGLRNDRGRVWHYRNGGWTLDGKRAGTKRWDGYDQSTRYGFWALVEQRGPLTEVPASSSGTGTEADGG